LHNPNDVHSEKLSLLIKRSCCGTWRSFI